MSGIDDARCGVRSYSAIILSISAFRLTGSRRSSCGVTFFAGFASSTFEGFAFGTSCGIASAVAMNKAHSDNDEPETQEIRRRTMAVTLVVCPARYRIRPQKTGNLRKVSVTAAPNKQDDQSAQITSLAASRSR